MNSPVAGLGDARSDRTGRVTEQRRAAIVAAAIDIFADRGFEGASTRELAEAVGLRQGHLYYYFPSKQDLLFAVVDGLHDEFLDGFEQWTALGDVDRLRGVIVGHIVTVCRNRRRTQVAYENTRFLAPELRDTIIAKRDRYETAVTQLIADRSAASADAVGLAARAVLGATNWVYQWYSEDGPLGPEALAGQLADLVMGMVAGAHRPPVAEPDPPLTGRNTP